MNDTFIWAGHRLRRWRGDQHFLAVGASGSGKTTLINHVAGTVLSDLRTRGLVYDPKQELLPFLMGLRSLSHAPHECGVVVLHPWDMRSKAWDMAADIDSAISARQLAAILVPDGEGGNKDSFFVDAVRDVLTGVLMAFIECIPNKGSWRFRDVLLAMLYEPYLNMVLGLKPKDEIKLAMLSRIRESYFGSSTDTRTKANIRASINARLAVFEPVGAAWHAAENDQVFGGLFSLKAWLEEQPNEEHPGTILVLGNDEAARSALDPINQALFRRATELVLARPERTHQERETGANQIWFFLDEVREAGKLDGLGRLLTKGRSKNACVVMGFQDIDGLRDVYGKELANEIVAQFNNVAVLRVNSPDTAQWASDLFGRRIEFSQSSSTSFSTSKDSGISIDRGKSEEERPFFHTEAFLYGSNAAAAKAVQGKRRGPDINIEGLSWEEVRARCSFTEEKEAPRVDKGALSELLKKSFPDMPREEALSLVSEHLPRPPSQQILAPWTESDFKRLGIDKPVPSLDKINAQSSDRQKPESIWKKWLPGSDSTKGIVREE